MFNKLIAAAFLLATPAFAQEVPDLAGPNLVIEVAGEANGTVVIDLLPDVAPKHVAQIVALARDGAYDDVVFHRVIDGFMAQTGDVQYGKASGDTAMAGMGGSSLPDLPAEFSDISFQRGIVGMARSADPDSANSQFFIMFAPGEFLDGQYTVVGRVISGMDVVDGIKRGTGSNGEVSDPDTMAKVSVAD
ncbi:MAG: peptidylprolyl isomerase [Rhodobacteraceae bacterium]|nr:peptidylprolyl isomerase [Paracoccaceae bacterium]